MSYKYEMILEIEYILISNFTEFKLFISRISLSFIGRNYSHIFLFPKIIVKIDSKGNVNMLNVKHFYSDGSVVKEKQCFYKGNMIRMYHLPESTDIFRNFEENCSAAEKSNKSRKYR